MQKSVLTVEKERKLDSTHKNHNQFDETLTFKIKLTNYGLENGTIW